MKYTQVRQLASPKNLENMGELPGHIIIYSLFTYPGHGMSVHILYFWPKLAHILKIDKPVHYRTPQRANMQKHHNVHVDGKSIFLYNFFLNYAIVIWIVNQAEFIIIHRMFLTWLSWDCKSWFSFSVVVSWYCSSEILVMLLEWEYSCVHDGHGYHTIH